jgi:methylenetetrahydrofolate reductase (NADPH)
MSGEKMREIATLEKKERSKGEKLISRIVLFFEDLIKIPIFRCQRCGECVLSSTAWICCQRCPKRLRNGPCGGTGEGGTCEVYPERKCIWYKIYYRSILLRRLPYLRHMLKSHNWNLEKTSAWLNVFTKRISPPALFSKGPKQHDTKR